MESKDGALIFVHPSGCPIWLRFAREDEAGNLQMRFTGPDDFARAAQYLESAMDVRLGNGYDVHRFGDHGNLHLGGVEIPGMPTLMGHSDGDALIHAIIDALLGAAGEGDIGEHFPPGEPATAGIDSRDLLTSVMRLVAARGYRVINVDATVIAERPRLREHLPRMREVLSQCLGVEAFTAVDVDLIEFEGIDSSSVLGQALVRRNEHRALITCREVRRFDGQMKTLFRVTRCEHDAGEIAVSAVHEQVDVTLLRLGR